MLSATGNNRDHFYHKTFVGVVRITNKFGVTIIVEGKARSCPGSAPRCCATWWPSAPPSGSWRYR